MARSRLYCLLFSWHRHLVCVSPIFASNCLKLNFKLFFLTDVSNYCEERKIKLSVNVYIKIARNLGSNFWNFGSNFLDFWQFFSNLLAFQWATFQHFTSTIGIALDTCFLIATLTFRNVHSRANLSPELSITSLETSLFSTIFRSNRCIRAACRRVGRIFVLTETIHAADTVVHR